MSKALFFLILTLIFVHMGASQEKDSGYQMIKNLVEKKKALEVEVVQVKQQLQSCLKREKSSGSNRGQDCSYQRSLRQKFQYEVKQLEEKLALSSYNKEGMAKLREKITELQQKHFDQRSRANRIDDENFILSRQRNQFKTKNQEILQRLKRLEEQSLAKERRHEQQLRNAKEIYERKIRQSGSSRCDGVSIDASKKYEQCQRQQRGFIDKIKYLEENALSKAKQFGEKIMQTKRQVFGRVKNFLTGNGPYTMEDERQFSEFKEKVNNLQRNIREKNNQVEKINKQKEDISLQQRYCRAKLTDFKSEIEQLEREAEAKGKGYYLREIKRLADQRFSDSRNEAKSDDSVIRSYQDKLLTIQKRLKEQVQQRNMLYNEKKKGQQKLSQLEKQLFKARKYAEEKQSQETRLRQQNRQLKKLLQLIYQVTQK